MYFFFALPPRSIQNRTDCPQPTNLHCSAEENRERSAQIEWISSWSVLHITRTFETFKVQFTVSEFARCGENLWTQFHTDRWYVLVANNSHWNWNQSFSCVGHSHHVRFNSAEKINDKNQNLMVRYLPSALARQCESKTWVSIDRHPNTDNSKSLWCNHLTTHHWHSTKKGFELENISKYNWIGGHPF